MVGVDYTSSKARSTEIYNLITVATVTKESFVKSLPLSLPATSLYFVRDRLPLTATYEVDHPAYSSFIQQAIIARFLYAKPFDSQSF